MTHLTDILDSLIDTGINDISLSYEPTAGPNGNNNQTATRFSGGEIAPDVGFRACDESCHHEDIGNRIARLRKQHDDALDNPLTLKLRPEGNWECRRDVFGTSENRSRRGLPTVEIFSTKSRNSQEPGIPPNLPVSQICETCTHFGFCMVAGGILTCKDDVEDDGDSIASQQQAVLDFIEKNEAWDEQAFQPSYTALVHSAQRCAACALFLNALPDPSVYICDERRPITIRAGLLRGVEGDLGIVVSHLKVGMPVVDARQQEEAVSVYGTVDVFADYGPPFAVAGRPVDAADDQKQPLRWLKECLENHKDCKPAAQENGISDVDLPTRLVYVQKDESEYPRLVETAGQKGKYLALSYCWGNAKITKTLEENLHDYKKSIPYTSLPKTFQDALIMARRLGFYYVWIDSLCIIQDSREDWAKEAAQMARIYSNAVLTLSASVSGSADSGLFYAPPIKYAPKLPLRTIKGKYCADFCITIRLASSFEDDVIKGNLNTRGWCLQERILSPRILHFGSSQLHWECSSGIWSASSTVNLGQRFGSTLSHQFLGSTSLPCAKPKEYPTILTEYRQVYAHQPHGTWYHMLRDYTSRSLTKAEDKLPALAGLATVFAQKTGDVYLNGLWAHGLPEGLLWSSPGLGFGIYDAKSSFMAPPSYRAPTWSWASLDGLVEYPAGRLGYIDAEFVGFTTIAQESNGKVRHLEELNERLFCDLDQGLILIARLLPLIELHGFREADREDLMHRRDFNTTYRTPHLRFDNPDRNIHDIDNVAALFIGQVGCGEKTCDHYADCSYEYGYCLLVERSRNSANIAQVVRIGVAQCFAADFVRSDHQHILIQ